jgi:hypothetical protein
VGLAGQPYVEGIITKAKGDVSALSKHCLAHFFCALRGDCPLGGSPDDREPETGRPKPVSLVVSVSGPRCPVPWRTRFSDA